MHITIPLSEKSDLFFEPVFGHPVFKHCLLYHARVSGQKDFCFSGDEHVFFRMQEAAKQDPELQSLVLQFTQKQAAESYPLNRLYLTSETFEEVTSSTDISSYKAKRASAVRLGAQSFVAKHINKRISIPLSFVLARFKISPNMISLFGLLLALMGGLCLLKAELYIFGFVCFQLNSLLDGCDGEVAKFNYSFSELGKKLDVYFDYVTTVLIFLFETLGLYLLTSADWVLYFGFFGGGLLIGTAIVSLATKHCYKSGDLNDLEVLCHQKLSQATRVWDKINKGILFVSRRDFYILTMLCLALLHCFYVIHVYLILLCLSWLLLSVYTLCVAKESCVS